MIDSSRIEAIMSDSLFREHELIDGKPDPELNPIWVEGIVKTFGFHPERLKNHEMEVQAMLNELPDTFTQGWTFLNMCFDKNHEQWTGLQATCEELMALGMALGYITYCAPRDFWNVLPGGVPYIQINQVS